MMIRNKDLVTMTSIIFLLILCTCQFILIWMLFGYSISKVIITHPLIKGMLEDILLAIDLIQSNKFLTLH